MQIRAEEISSIIKNQINDYESKVEVAETGTVLSVGDGIARIYGLRSAMAGEMIEFDEGTRAIVLNLEEGNVGVAIMGSGAGIREGSTAKRTGEIAQVPVGPALLGRVVDALGRPVDGQGDIDDINHHQSHFGGGETAARRDAATGHHGGSNSEPNADDPLLAVACKRESQHPGRVVVTLGFAMKDTVRDHVKCFHKVKEDLCIAFPTASRNLGFGRRLPGSNISTRPAPA